MIGMVNARTIMTSGPGRFPPRNIFELLFENTGELIHAVVYVF